MDDWEIAGEIAAKALVFGKGLIKVDASLLEATEKIERKIYELGGECAFPINISINYIAAHYTALRNDKTVFSENDLVKLDIGVHVNGCIGDNACSVDLGNNKELVMASEEALKEAIKAAKPGTKVCEIGRVIQDKIKEYGFSPIKNLSGHEIKRFNLHAGVTIPNYDNGDKSKLVDGQIIAIEPFATNGIGRVVNGKPSGIYKLINKKQVRDSDARKILDFIDKKYKTLPFTKRWLKFNMLDLKLNILEKEKIIYQYPQLPEENKGLVSQAEETILVGKGVLTKV